MLRRLFQRYPALSVCAIVGLAAALVILERRLTVERAYHTVEITADGDDWAQLARRSGMERRDLYAALYRRGVRSITLYATSLRRLSDAGLVTYMAGADVVNAARAGSLGGPLADLVRAGRIHTDDTYVLGSMPVLRLVRAGFAVQVGASRTAILSGSGPVLEIQGRGPDLLDASLGVLPQELHAVLARGLAAELRVRNFGDVAPGGLEAFFARLRQFRQPFTLIFDRDQVLGYARLLPAVAAEMRHDGFAFGQIEAFTAKRRQKGEEVLARLVAPRVIRVFSLTPQELAGLTPASARDKFVLAARERNVRILYIRPFLATPAGVDPVAANLDYVGSIADDLVRAGYTLGKATPMPPVRTSGVLFLLMALGTIAAVAIAVGEVGEALVAPVPARRLLAGTAAGTLLTAALIAIHHTTLWRQILAFLAALAFPTLSMLYLVPGARRPERDDAPTQSPAGSPSGVHILVRSIGGLWAVSAVTALGGVMVTALLSEWSFMMEIRQFLGVKAAFIVPVALVGLLIAAAGAPRGGLWPRLRAWLRQPLRLEYGVLTIVVGVVAVFALGRTGNSGLPLLSGAELRSRVVLQRVLVARPRTKEYLIGDPAMVLTFALAATGARAWVLPAAMVGAIGQVGLVDSFSHIHTPLVYVFFRTVYALAIGSVLGAVLVGLLWGSRRWWRSYEFSSARQNAALDPRST
jgi:hypothetical protein